jgi:translation initiation factor IF-1
MLAKLTAKNRLTLPKAIIDAVGSAEYFEVEARGSQIVLTPVRIRRADSVRARIAELDLTKADITGAIRRARRPGNPTKPRK